MLVLVQNTCTSGLQFYIYDLQVKTWFQNRRMKEKRAFRESDKMAAVAPLPNLHVAVHPSPLAVMNQNPIQLPHFPETSYSHVPKLSHFNAPITAPHTLPMAPTTVQPSWNMLPSSEYGQNPVSARMLNTMPVGAISAAPSHSFTSIALSSCSSGLVSKPAVFHNKAILATAHQRYVWNSYSLQHAYNKNLFKEDIVE